MINFLCCFKGKKINAIGISYTHTNICVTAKDKEHAKLALYEKYDHISGLEIEKSVPPTKAGKRS